MGLLKDSIMQKIKKSFFPGRLVIALLLLVQLVQGPALAREEMNPIEPAVTATEFTLMSTDGRDIKLSDYEGQFVLVNFWATWCPPCVEEMPSLDNLHKHFAGANFKVLGVHAGPALVTVKTFLEKHPVSFDIVIDKKMELSSWGVTGLPTTFLVSPEGEIIYKAVGECEWDSDNMFDFIEAVIAKHKQLASIH